MADAAPDRGPPPDADGTSGPGGRGSRIALALLAVTALVAATSAGLAWFDDRDRTARAEVATGFTLALLSYDHADLDASLAAVSAVSTPRFAREYRERFTEDLAPELAELRAVATAEVTEVFLATDPPGTATRDVERTRALVAAEVEIRPARGEPRRTTPTLELVLVRTGEGWRVDDAGGTGRAGLEPSS